MAINPNILVDWSWAYTTNGQIISDLTTDAGELTASSNLSVIQFGLTWIENNLALFLLIIFLTSLMIYVNVKRRKVMQG